MLNEYAKQIAESVKQSVKTALDALSAKIEPRLKSLEDGRAECDAILKKLDDSIAEKLAKAIADLPPAKDGENGKSVELADVQPMIAEAVKAAVDALPPPKDGEPGKNGESVDFEQVKTEITDAVARAVAAMPAPKDGQDGKSVDPEDIKIMVADAVAAIPPAKDGKSVPVEEVQAMIDEAVKKAVSAIKLPEPEHGRDALDLEILSGIDEEKSYPRGTYATHRGGLWKSFKKTQGMNGWECIVDGVFNNVVTQKGARDFAFISERSSGAMIELPFRVPSMQYKKVFVDGTEYDEGDTVTWGGSMWYCNRKTLEKPGEGSKDWTLAAKRGRDGTPKVKV